MDVTLRPAALLRNFAYLLGAMKPGELPLAIGVDLGATTVKTGVVRADGVILYQNKFPAEAGRGPAGVLKQLEASVRDALGRTEGRPVSGIGVGSPGVVSEAGVVQAPPNFASWDSVPLADEIQRRFSLPVKVENDANAAAIAESRFGAGKEHRDFLFVIWGTGVGGGIILDRTIYRGPSGGAGEIGHVTIDYQGPLCNCGNRGCIEAYVGQRYLSRRTAERLKDYPGSRILELVGSDPEKIEPLFIAQAAQEGDTVAVDILKEAGTLLGVAIASVMNTLDLRVSVLGGGVSSAGAFVWRAIEESVRSRVLAPLRPAIRVIPAQLGNDAGILGAGGLVL